MRTFFNSLEDIYTLSYNVLQLNINRTKNPIIVPDALQTQTSDIYSVTHN